MKIETYYSSNAFKIKSGEHGGGMFYFDGDFNGLMREVLTDSQFYNKLSLGDIIVVLSKKRAQIILDYIKSGKLRRS